MEAFLIKEAEWWGGNSPMLSDKVPIDLALV